MDGARCSGPSTPASGRLPDGIQAEVTSIEKAGDEQTGIDQALARGPGWPAVPDESGPLAGIRVLDLSRVLAGPYATMVLGDLGADVIKIERPGRGDDTRQWGPPFHGPDAAYFLSVNRNRRSLTVDLTTEAGRAVVAVLAASADVVIENFLPQHLEALGLDGLRDRTNDTVWVSVRAAGTDGPAGGRAGYDVMAQARGGLMSITGFPSTGPTKVGVAISDVLTGLHAAVGALAGLIARGRRLDRPDAPRLEVGLLEVTVAALVNQAANHLIGGQHPGLLGNDHPNLAPYGPVRCADGLLVVGAGNDRQFRSLCRAIDRPELGSDPRYATNAARVTHRGELADELEQVFSTRRVGEWRTVLDEAGVPAAPVNTVPEAVADDHVAAVGLVSEVAHPDGPIRLVGAPLRVDGQRPGIRRAPPRLGEHNDEILRGLGLDDAQIAMLRDASVI